MGTAVAVISSLDPPAPAAGECVWAIPTLAYDAQLDDQQAEAVAGGRDTRYGSGPAVVTYYQHYAAEWHAVGVAIQAACATPPAPLSDAERNNAVAWFTKAADAHMADTATHPENASWNQEWEANYARLRTLVAGLP